MINQLSARSVLFIVADFHTNMFPMVRALTAAGVDVHVVCVDPGRWHAQSGVTPIVLDPHDCSKADVRRILDATRPDVVVLRHWTGRFPHFTRLAQRRGAATVFYNQAPLNRPRGIRPAVRDLSRLAGRIALRLPRHRVTPVRGPTDGVPTRATSLLPFPMPVADGARTRDWFAGGTPTVLCVGKLDHPRKRQHWILDAAEKTATPFRIVLVSPPARALTNDRPTAAFPQGKATGYREYRAALLNRVRSGPLRDRVEVRIDVPYSEMPAIYRRADIFVLPSRNEPFAISPLEAMAAGAVPVICDTNGATTYVTHGHDGVVVPVDDFTTFVSELDALVSSRERTAALGTAAVATVEHNHDPNGFADAFFASVRRTVPAG